MDSSQYPELNYTPCKDGFAAAIAGDKNNTFKCNNVSSVNIGYKCRRSNDIRSTCTTSCLTHSLAV